jgi:S1-C subfamily serine protease
MYRVTIEHCRITVPQLATAFRVDDRNLISAAHPFVDMAEFELFTSEGAVVPAELIALVPEKDIAVVRLVTSSDLEPLALAEAEIEPNTAVEIPTFDDDRLLEVNNGLAVRRAEVTLNGEDPRRSIELQADIVAGDSGAPVVVNGKAAGVVFATTRGRDGGWAVSLPEILAVLATAEEESNVVPTACD